MYLVVKRFQHTPMPVLLSEDDGPLADGVDGL